MPRKSAALLASTPVKLDKLSRDFLAKLQDTEPAHGCEEQWVRYIGAAEAYEQAYTRAEMVGTQVEKEGGSSSCQTWPAFIEAQRAQERAMSAVFGALDSYLHAVKHKDDKRIVPEAEVRAIVIDSISDKLDELKFNIKPGLLGSQVAQAIYKLTSEESAGEPAFCADCG